MRRAAKLIQAGAVVVMLTACDKGTFVKLTLDAGQAIEPGCIAGLEREVAAIDAFRPLRETEGTAVQNFSIVRGGGTVFVMRESPTSRAMELSFGWLGPSDEQQERDSVALLADVRNAVLRTCGIDNNTVRVSSHCVGTVCKLPEIAAMNIGSEGGEAQKQ